MKNIKSFAALAICICTTTLLQAQELKTEVAKPIEAKVPVAGKNGVTPLFTPGGEEGRKITEGKAEKPKEPLVLMPNSANPNAGQLLKIKAAVLKEGQKQ